MRVGVFGGTFDPPHLGHLILASEAFFQLHLDEVQWVLTPNPPHKGHRSIGSLSQRLDLLKLAIAENPSFTLSTIDMDRPAPHYAVDTIRLLKDQNPEWELVYLVGGDSLQHMPDWYRPRDLVQHTDEIGVMRRPGDIIDVEFLEGRLPGLKKKLRFVDSPLLEISASEIRQRIREGSHFRYFLPDSVYERILVKGYYS